MICSKDNKIILRARTSPGSSSSYWHDAPRPGARLSMSISSSPLEYGLNCNLLHARAVSPDKPQAGRRILFFSDLHWNPGNTAYYARLAHEINGIAADWIIFGGDLSTYMDSIADALGWLKGLRARCGKCAVLGNRESPVAWLDMNFWRQAYAEAGYRFLCNELLEDRSLLIYGLDDVRFGKADWSPLQPFSASRLPVLSISHNPDGAGIAPKDCYLGDLVLSGHTHGGQIRLPLLGPVYTSSRFGRQFLNGLKQRDDGTLCHISSGIGESGMRFLSRRRIFCPHEMLLLEI